VVVGDGGVGKTNITNVFCKTEPFLESSKATVGVEFGICNYTLPNGRAVDLQVWDTAGQDRFRSVTKGYYRGAHAAMIVFDITSKLSFEHVGRWLSEVREQSGPKAILLLVGNKSDLSGLRTVLMSDAIAYAASEHLAYIETSARDYMNIDEAFRQVILEIVDASPSRSESAEELDPNAAPERSLTEPSIKLTLQPPPQPPKKGSCCVIA